MAIGTTMLIFVLVLLRLIIYLSGHGKIHMTKLTSLTIQMAPFMAQNLALSIIKEYGHQFLLIPSCTIV